MKRWGIPALLALGVATPAQALSLSDLSGLLQGACGNTQISSIFNIKGACQLYEALRPGFNVQNFLNYARDTLATSVVSGALQGIGDATNQAFLNNLSDTLGNIANGIREAYNLPYRLVDGIAQGVWSETYGQVYNYFSGAYQSLADGVSSTISASYSIKNLSLNNTSPDSVAQAYSSLGISVPEGYDKGTLSSLSQNTSLAAANLNSLAETNKATAISLARTGITELAPAEEATFRAELARQQAQDAAEQTVRAGAAKATTERGAELARQATQLGVDDPTKGEKSLATQYKERADNAVSDRELLQLQVKAIADSMANQALNNQLLAEYLRAVAQEQVMSTDAVRDEVRALRESMEGPMLPGPSAKDRVAQAQKLAEEAEAIRQSSLRQVEPAISALNTICQVYGLGDCE